MFISLSVNLTKNLLVLSSYTIRVQKHPFLDDFDDKTFNKTLRKIFKTKLTLKEF